MFHAPLAWIVSVGFLQFPCDSFDISNEIVIKGNSTSARHSNVTSYKQTLLTHLRHSIQNDTTSENTLLRDSLKVSNSTIDILANSESVESKNDTLRSVMLNHHWFLPKFNRKPPPTVKMLQKSVRDSFTNSLNSNFIRLSVVHPVQRTQLYSTQHRYQQLKKSIAHKSTYLNDPQYTYAMENGTAIQVSAEDCQLHLCLKKSMNSNNEPDFLCKCVGIKDDAGNVLVLKNMFQEIALMSRLENAT